MGETASFGLFFLVIMAMIVFAPDVIAHGAQYIKANEVAKYGIELIEHEGGVNQQVEAEIQNKIKSLNLDTTKFSVQFSSYGNLNHGEKVSIKIAGNYKYHAINLLGTGIGNFNMPITVQKTGYSEVYFRS